MEKLVFLISLISVLLSSGFAALSIFPHRPFRSFLVYATLAGVQITCSELFLGSISRLTLVNTTWLIIVLGILLTILTWKNRLFFQSLQSDATETSQLNQKGWTYIGVLFGFVGLLISKQIYNLLLHIFLIHPLTWDTVSYHLPNVLDYINTQSLWTLKGSFSYYPGGNELFNIWHFMGLRSDVLLGFIGILPALGSVVCFSILVSFLLPSITPFLSASLTILFCVFILINPDLNLIIHSFGRNDLMLAFWESASICYLYFSMGSKTLLSRNTWMTGSGVCLGLAIGIKPNGLLFAFGIIGLVISSLYRPSFAFSLRQKLSSLPYLLTPMLMIGMFWYARNLLVLGRLSNDDGNIFSGSILFQSINPSLYQLSSPFYAILYFVFVTIVGCLVLLLKHPQSQPEFRLMMGIQVVSLLSFVLTPYSAGYLAGGQWNNDIQIRYGIVLFVTSAALSIYYLASIADYLVQQKILAMGDHCTFASTLSSNTYPSSSRYFAFVHLPFFILISLQFLSYQYPRGLPGHNQILFNPQNAPISQVYNWVQSNLVDTHIYSVGLRPYGLYGYPFSNDVFYELGSQGWTYRNGLQIIQENQLEYLVISRDPFSGDFPEDLNLLIQSSDLFEIVYQDPLAFVFHVSSQINPSS